MCMLTAQIPNSIGFLDVPRVKLGFAIEAEPVSKVTRSGCGQRPDAVVDQRRVWLWTNGGVSIIDIYESYSFGGQRWFV